jgi:hypothetical protein
MEYKGARVNHTSYGQGTITDKTNTHVIITFDSLPDTSKKFPFPQCFSKYVEILDNSALKENSDILVDEENKKEQQRITEEKEQLRNDVLAMQKVTMSSRQAKQAATQTEKKKTTRKRKAPARKKEVTAEKKTAVSEVEGLDSAGSISVSDPWTFVTAADVLKHVFRADCESWNRDFYYFDDERSQGVWFVKLTASADASAETWACEQIDESTIRMYTRNLSLSSHSQSQEPLYAFTKRPGEPYRFAGIFQRDSSRSNPRDVWYVRTGDTLDLTPWRS